MRIGDWTVIPSQNVIERDGAFVKLEPRAMDLLVYLAGAGRRVVSPDELLRDVWHGRVFDDGVVYKKINQLRKALGDDSHHPRFIETIPKRGYRLVAPVVLDEAQAREGHSAADPSSSGPTPPLAAGVGSTLRRWRLGVGSSPSPRPRRWRLGALAFAVAAAALTGLAIVDERWQAPEERLVFTPLRFQREADGELVRDFGLKDTLCAFASTEPSLYCIRDLFGQPMWIVVALDDGSTRRPTDEE